MESFLHWETLKRDFRCVMLKTEQLSLSWPVNVRVGDLGNDRARRGIKNCALRVVYF